MIVLLGPTRNENIFSVDTGQGVETIVYALQRCDNFVIKGIFHRLLTLPSNLV